MLPSIANNQKLSQAKNMVNKFNKLQQKNFGILSEYNDRKNKKLIGGGHFLEEPKFWVTSCRPPNFGDHLDTRTKVDNWFDENRLYNEENRDYDIRRAQIYIYHGFNISFYVLAAKYSVFILYQWLIGRQRYIRDTYKEFDVGCLPPGEVMQTTWNGEPIFVRRLTKSDVANEDALPKSTLLDTESEVYFTPTPNSQILVCSALCTHLGCLPVPYLGAYKGWVCLCHGSVYDKSGRVRQGPALKNLPYINNSIYGDILCVEEQVFPNEPSTIFYI
jgi:ubiquinol-cytochrome c reductase iron-sulfur subunit